MTTTTMIIIINNDVNGQSIKYLLLRVYVIEWWSICFFVIVIHLIYGHFLLSGHVRCTRVAIASLLVINPRLECAIRRCYLWALCGWTAQCFGMSDRLIYSLTYEARGYRTLGILENDFNVKLPLDKRISRDESHYHKRKAIRMIEHHSLFILTWLSYLI